MKFSTVNWRTVSYMFSNLYDSTSSLPIITEMGKYEYIFDELRDLIPFVQFKKSEKHRSLQLY